MAKPKPRPLRSKWEHLEAKLAAAEAHIENLEAALAEERRQKQELAEALDALRIKMGSKVKPAEKAGK